jgi:flagellar protein FlgJ
MQIAQAAAQQTLPPDRQRMMDKAKELEAAFLTEMLSHAGLNAQTDSFGGGAGEDQFASFLRGEQAKLIVEKGGVGLAESIFKSMVKAQGSSHDT